MALRLGYRWKTSVQHWYQPYMSSIIPSTKATTNIVLSLFSNEWMGPRECNYERVSNFWVIIYYTKKNRVLKKNTESIMKFPRSLFFIKIFLKKIFSSILYRCYILFLDLQTELCGCGPWIWLRCQSMLLLMITNIKIGVVGRMDLPKRYNFTVGQKNV